MRFSDLRIDNLRFSNLRFSNLRLNDLRFSDLRLNGFSKLCVGFLPKILFCSYTAACIARLIPLLLFLGIEIKARIDDEKRWTLRLKVE